MARLKNGILGGFQGKVGTVVGCNWKGIEYMRSLPRPRTSNPSEKETKNRLRFSVLQYWLKPLTPFLRVGFKKYTPTVEGFLAAKSYNSNAVKGEYPNYYVDHEIALVSFGNLSGAVDAKAISSTPAAIDFTWNPSTPENNADSIDRVMLLAYDTEGNEVVYTTSGAMRKQGKDVLLLDSFWSGKEADVFIAFISDDRGQISKSQYLGKILVT